MNVDQMIEKKREYGYSNEKIAKLSGIPLSTVQKIFSGETKSPRYDTVQAISAVFEKVERGFADEIRESGAAYQAISQGTMKSIKEYGEKTISDYLALPEGARVEMIDGVFYDSEVEEHIVQIAVFVLDNIVPYGRLDDQGRRPGKDQDRSGDLSSPEFLVEHKSNDEAKQRREPHDRKHPPERIFHDCLECRQMNRIRVVLKSHKAAYHAGLGDLTERQPEYDRDREYDKYRDQQYTRQKPDIRFPPAFA